MKNKIRNRIIKQDRENLFNSRRQSKIVCLTAAILFFNFLNLACQPNQAILNSSRQTENNTSTENAVERPKETYESVLSGVQKSGFDYIFVFRRKDGGKFEKDDKVFLRENAPAETNQFVLTDEDRVAIAGSNYPFPEDTLEVLRILFNIEDLSPKKAEAADGNANQANVNANKKAQVNSNK